MPTEMKTFDGPCMVIRGPDELFSMPLPKGHRFMLFEKGITPLVLPMTSPGEYGINLGRPGEGSKGATWPLLVIGVPVDAIEHMQSMPKEEIDRFIDTVVAHADRQNATLQ